MANNMASKGASKRTSKSNHHSEAMLSESDTEQTGSGKKVPTVKSAKGEKARAKLMRAALVVMERTGYHKMRIADVTGEAGVAAGLFYHYFPDLKSLTVEVLESYIAKSLNVKDIEKNVPKGDWFERIRAHTALVVNSYTRQPGIMRCLLQLADEDKSFASTLRENFIQQLNWLVAQMPKLFPEANMSNQQALLVVYALAGTAETLLHHYYVDQEAQLRSENTSADEMIELLAVMFYRGLFLENPPAEKLSYTTPLLNMVRQPPLKN
jgi:AcrR family transcriptional regulator